MTPAPKFMTTSDLARELDSIDKSAGERLDDVLAKIKYYRDWHRVSRMSEATHALDSLYRDCLFLAGEEAEG